MIHHHISTCLESMSIYTNMIDRTHNKFDARTLSYWATTPQMRIELTYICYYTRSDLRFSNKKTTTIDKIVDVQLIK